MNIDHFASVSSTRRARVSRAARVVVIVALALAAPLVTPLSAQTAATYSIELLLEPTPKQAERAAAAARKRLGPGHRVRVETTSRGYAVRVDAFESTDQAWNVLRRYRERGYPDARIVFAPPPNEAPAAVEAAPDPAAEQPSGVTPTQPSPLPPVEPTPPPGAPELRPPPAPSPEPVPEPESAPDEIRAVEPPGPAPEPEPGAALKQIRATRIEGDAPELDGKLDDAAWRDARFVSDFQQKGARGGWPTRLATDVAFRFDDRALYVAARMHVRDGGVVRAPVTRRDQAGDADLLVVSLDTLRDRQTAYNFGVTAGGARIDYYQPRDVFEVRDYDFDPVWDAAVSVNHADWTAEMRIPFSSLRFHPHESAVWGVNLQRLHPQERVYAFWVVVPSEETGWSSRFGELVGLDGIRSPRRFEITPYVVGRRVEGPRSGDIQGEEPEDEWRYGGDLGLDITPNLALDATFRPDFGQIEADPAVVNLTAYEVFFPEKRPFFLEDAQLLQGSGPRYYYSRRIGSPPHGDLDGTFDEEGTTILGAARLVGRTEAGFASGTLLAVTEEERASQLIDPVTGSAAVVPVEPQTFWGVTRLQKDFGAGSTFGFVGTGVQRDLPTLRPGGDPGVVVPGSLLVGLLPERAFSGGFDWNLRFANQSHELAGWAGGSYVEGSPAAITRLQLSSARYYQRPDADHVELDPTATDLSGYSAGLSLARVQGAWRWLLSGTARSPGFEINDLGAMATADDLEGYARLAWGRPMSGKRWQRIDVAAAMSSSWNYGRVLQHSTPSLELYLVSANFWRTTMILAHDLEATSDSLTRGGPLMATPPGWRYDLGLRSNDSRKQIWSINGYYADDELGSSAWGGYTTWLSRSTRRFTFSITPGYDQVLQTRQYYATVPGGRVETFGGRYVFAALDQETVYARLRAGIAFTPELGFDLYVEPFASRGSYARIGELVAAGGNDLRLYGSDDSTIVRQEDGTYLVTDGAQTFTLPNLDFDVTSFRVNAVLRWEYLPGSLLYLVWTQNRDAELLTVGRVGAGDLVEALDPPAEDVFSVKLSFRIGRW